ncbi:MAG: DNA double-strand break repair nuclease NurA [Acidimicrobiales bacterium]
MLTVAETAERLARLLRGAGDEAQLSDPGGHELEFFDHVRLEPLKRGQPPEDCWAVDGGQALVADARTLQVAVTRASRCRWQGGRSSLEDEGQLKVHLLAGTGGGPEARRSLSELGAPVLADAPVDINLLRDWSEWQLVARCVQEAGPGALVLVDGDLQPDWRVPADWLANLVDQANRRAVSLVGVTKHSSLARGGAPLVGQLELEAEALFGPRACWWAPIARTRSERGPVCLVVVARLDPDARFAFRIDLAGTPSTAALLGQLSALSDDAAFPGYPYPLSVADQLAACPGWLREELWSELETALSQAGVPEEVTERAFADRHHLMERT